MIMKTFNKNNLDKFMSLKIYNFSFFFKIKIFIIIYMKNLIMKLMILIVSNYGSKNN